jgi:AraC-like DNA-binding protein
MGYIGLPVLKTGWATGPVPPQGGQCMPGGLRARRQERDSPQPGCRQYACLMSAEATIRILHRDDELQLGEFTCPPADRRWRDENDIGEGFHVVFPWTPVQISRRAMPSLVATPNHAVLYSPRLRFHRRYLTNEGDHCLFAVLSPSLCTRLGLGGGGSLVDPVLSPSLWLAQRVLAEYLRRPDHDPEAAGHLGRRLVESALASVPYCSGAPAGHAVEQTKELMALSPGRLLPLDLVARQAHYSRFHLLRSFHARTGYTLHQYHLQLRLRRSVDMVLAGVPLADIAHHLGFQGHSHFTARFRRSFGWTPSGLRTIVASQGDVPDVVSALLPAA